MIKIYGKQRSRASRCMWVLEELGVPYEQVPLDTQNGDTKSPEFLLVNPSGKVPVLDDDGFILRESVAIVGYLAAKAGAPLWPDDARSRAIVNQWSMWAATEVEGPLGIVFHEQRRMTAAGGDIDAAFVGGCLTTATNALKLLDGHLGSSRYVAGDQFTIGDINAAGTVMLAPMFVELTPFPAVREWLGRCLARPTWQRVTARP